MNETEIAAAYERYGALVLRRCRRILRHQVAAEDALQEVFVRLMRNERSFVAADSKVAWLYRVADHCCFDHLRRNRRLELVDRPDELTTRQTLEERDLVMRFLARFDARLQQLAVLHYLDGMTQEEIAAATGWSRQTVFNKLTFLRQRAQSLRQSLVGDAS